MYNKNKIRIFKGVGVILLSAMIFASPMSYTAKAADTEVSNTVSEEAAISKEAEEAYGVGTKNYNVPKGGSIEAEVYVVTRDTRDSIGDNVYSKKSPKILNHHKVDGNSIYTQIDTGNPNKTITITAPNGINFTRDTQDTLSSYDNLEDVKFSNEELFGYEPNRIMPTFDDQGTVTGYHVDYFFDENKTFEILHSDKNLKVFSKNGYDVKDGNENYLSHKSSDNSKWEEVTEGKDSSLPIEVIIYGNLVEDDSQTNPETKEKVIYLTDSNSRIKNLPDGYKAIRLTKTENDGYHLDLIKIEEPKSKEDKTTEEPKSKEDKTTDNKVETEVPVAFTNIEPLENTESTTIEDNNTPLAATPEVNNDVNQEPVILNDNSTEIGDDATPLAARPNSQSKSEIKENKIQDDKTPLAGVPKTGENNKFENIMLLTMEIAGIALAAIVGFVMKKKKDNR